jgi:AcrR family transcriptional regulator
LIKRHLLAIINRRGKEMLLEQEKSVDLRVRRTRHLLQQAFIELMAEKGFQAITVQDIAKRAMVNRATFYDHFVDKYALLEHSISEWFKQTLHSKAPQNFEFSTENLEFLILTTCEFLTQLRQHCLPKDQELLPLVQTEITTLIYEVLLSWLKEAAVRTPPPQLAAMVTSWAIYGAAYYWSQQERREPTQDFVHRTLPMIMASLNQGLNVS